MSPAPIQESCPLYRDLVCFGDKSAWNVGSSFIRYLFIYSSTSLVTTFLFILVLPETPSR